MLTRVIGAETEKATWYVCFVIELVLNEGPALRRTSFRRTRKVHTPTFFRHPPDHPFIKGCFLRGKRGEFESSESSTGTGICLAARNCGASSVSNVCTVSTRGWPTRMPRIQDACFRGQLSHRARAVNWGLLRARWFVTSREGCRRRRAGTPRGGRTSGSTAVTSRGVRL